MMQILVDSSVILDIVTEEELDAVLPSTYFRRLPLPWEAAFLASKCFLEYRRKGGRKRSPLPDF